MEIKLANSSYWKFLAVLWFAFSGVQFYGATDLNSILMLVSGALGVVVGISYLKVTKFTYLTLENEIITIHVRRLPWKKRIQYDDINKVEVVGKEILLHLKNGRIAKLKNNWISNKNFSRIKKELQQHSITVR